MATPANLTYSAIETRVMNSLRLATTNTVEQAKVQNLINEVYRDVAAKNDWWWLLKRTVINGTPKITTPTASLTLNSATGTFSAAPQQNSVNVAVGGFVMLVPGASQDAGAVYRITSTHTAGATAFALDAAYTNVTSTAAALRLYQDSYSLPTDTGKVLNVKRYGFRPPLRRVGIEEMSALKLWDQSEGAPQVYSVFDEATTGDPTTQRLLQVHPYPDANYHRLEVFYKQNLNTELTGTARPLIPDDFAQILVYGALARGYAIFLNDTERSKFFQSLFNDVLALMVAQQKEYASDKSGIAPRDSYTTRPRGGRRVGGRGTLGNLFDIFPRDW